MTLLRLALASIAMLFLGPRLAAAQAAAPPADPVQEVLVLGRISDDPKQHYEALRPLLD